MLQEIETSLFDAGMLEIYRFVPPALLEGKSFEDMEIDEFLGYIAKARYIQNVESLIVQRGVVNAFPAPEG